MGSHDRVTVDVQASPGSHVLLRVNGRLAAEVAAASVETRDCLEEERSPA